VTTLGPGDVVYIPRYWQHQLRNRYARDFQFVDIYWDHRGRSFEEVAAAEREGVPA
jgi:oxalate decarboxylase/phosphoglucose isomerase-like protein (cupin superfamily)